MYKEMTESEKKYWQDHYKMREHLQRLDDLGVDLTIPPNWVKYNLGLSGIAAMDFSLASDDEAREYMSLVRSSHNAVAYYLDHHPEKAEAYLSNDLAYLDVLKFVAPKLEEKVNEWIGKFVFRAHNRDVANGVKIGWK
jgi:hypothetical protein